MIWCFVIWGLMSIGYGIVMIRSGRTGELVSTAHYKRPRMVTGRTAITMGVGYIVLGVVVIAAGYFLDR